MYRITYACLFLSILVPALNVAVSNAASGRLYNKKQNDQSNTNKGISLIRPIYESGVNRSATNSEINIDSNSKGNNLDNVLVTNSNSGNSAEETVSSKSAELAGSNPSSQHKQIGSSTSVNHRNTSQVILQIHSDHAQDTVERGSESFFEEIESYNNQNLEDSGHLESLGETGYARNGPTSQSDHSGSFHNHPRIKHFIHHNVGHKEEQKHGVARQHAGQSVSRSVRHLTGTDDIIDDVITKRHRPDIVSLKTTVTSQENDELEPLVLGLREELKNVQATHIRTRSVINELQEKQDAQERDMVIFKNELSKLRQEQQAQRQQIDSLGDVTSDLSWALADMKQAQAQSAADFVAFKQVQVGVTDDLRVVKQNKEGLVGEVTRLTTEQKSVLGVVKSLRTVQGQHNDTLLVMEEVIMSNALELQTLHQNAANVRGELESVRELMTEDRQRLKHLESEVHIQNKQYRSMKDNSSPKQKSNSSSKDQKNREWRSTNSNEWIKLDRSTPKLSSLSDRRDGLEVELEIDSKFRPGETHITPAKLPQPLHGLQHQQTLTEFGLFKSTIQAKLEIQAADLASLRELSSNLTHNIASLNSTVQTMNRRQLIDLQLLNLQQSVVNLTRKVLHDHSTTGSAKDMMNVNSANSSVTQNGKVPWEYNDILKNLQQSATQLSEELRLHESQSSMILRDVEERVKELGTRLWRAEDQLRQYELGSLNATLQQCRQVNSELRGLQTLGEVLQQLSHLDLRVNQQGQLGSRLEASIQRVEEQLTGKDEATLTGDNQLTLLGGMLGDMVSIKQELYNFIVSLPTDCQSALRDGSFGSSLHSKLQGSQFYPDGVFLIRPLSSNYSLRVYCVARLPIPGTVSVRSPSSNDQGGEGRGEDGNMEVDGRLGTESVWTVIQRRVDGRETFGRTWDEYKFGFGDVTGEFWLGNEHIHRLTSDQGREGSRSIYRLRIEIWDVLGRFWVAEYSSVKVESEANLYRLDLGHYSSGNASDALRYSNLMPFSTIDRDNDISTTHCAQFYESGWWYKHCHYSNLNGRYTSGVVWYHESLDEWLQLNRTMMMISRVEENYANSFLPPVTQRPDGQR